TSGPKLTLSLDKPETIMQANGLNPEPVQLSYTLKHDKALRSERAVVKLRITDCIKESVYLEDDQGGRFELGDNVPYSKSVPFPRIPVGFLAPPPEIMLKPGEYRVQILFEGLSSGNEAMGTLSSNELVLRVLPEVKGLRGEISLAKTKF